MARVYRAWQESLQRWVAVKWCQGDRQAFRDEALLLASLSHPTLVGVHEYIEEADQAYLVMELIQGQTLRQWVDQRGPAEESQVRQWLEQLLVALEYLHGQEPPVILRDLKPENVMVEGDGRVRLLDLGIAKRLILGEQTQLHLKGMGSEYYAPLEQYGQGSTDQRSDFYSLGATLYFALTGQDPMPAWQRLPKRTPLECESSLASLITGLTALFPQDRPADVTAVRALLRGPRARARSVTRVRGLQAELRQRWDVSAAVQGSGEHLAWQGERLLVAAETLMRIDVGAARLMRQTGKKLQPTALATSHDGRRLALATRDQGLLYWPGPDSTPRQLQLDSVPLWLHFLPGQTIAAHGGGHTLAAYDLRDGKRLRSYGANAWWLWLNGKAYEACAGDAQRLAAAARDGSLLLWNQSDGAVLWQAQHSSFLGALEFSRDGHFLLAAPHAGGLTVWQAATGQCLAENSSEEPFQKVYSLPDGRALLAVSEHAVMVWDFARAQPLLRVQTPAPIRASALARNGWLACALSDGRVQVYEFGVS